MMQNLKILNSKEIKHIIALLEEHFGFNKKLDYAFLMNNKNRIFLIDKDFAMINSEKIRINTIGLYFGEINGQDIRLSIEGSQLIGKDCTKNIIDLDETFAREWLHGIDISYDYKDRGFVILRSGNDFIGCGKAVDKKILNYIPKNRRVKSID